MQCMYILCCMLLSHGNVSKLRLVLFYLPTEQALISNGDVIRIIQQLTQLGFCYKMALVGLVLVLDGFK